MIDGEELRENAGLGVRRLRRQHRIPQPGPRGVEEIVQERPVIRLRGSIQAQPARRERRERPFSLRLQQLLGERVEVGKMVYPFRQLSVSTSGCRGCGASEATREAIPCGSYVYREALLLHRRNR